MNSQPVLALSAVMLLAGVGIPIMAALNSGLGVRIGSPVLAATILFALALTISSVALLPVESPATLKLSDIHPLYFTGGVFVAFYVLSVTIIAPKIGVGNAIVLVLLGQVVAASAIDHFGWMGAPQTLLTPARAIGMVLIAVGIVLARRQI